jgi:AraC family transcriptional regulator of adaptative response/methylated-DNA-[protein]-cysteine methyltransferase
MRFGRKRWQAVQKRDGSADGAFVYGVRSTGIYCRPSCPARKPRLDQVVFFPLPEAAEEQGFRECRRCQPRSVSMRDPKIDTIARVCRGIEAGILDGFAPEAPAGRALTLTALGASVGMSPHQLDRAFRSAMGITPPNACAG